MFGARKTNDDSEQKHETQAASNRTEQAPRTESGASAPRATPAQVAPRHVINIPSGRRSGAAAEGDRTLRVGKGLSVTGEITACDVLVVEGKVEAKLNEGKLLEIAEAGQFRGNVEIENADIAGRYDGQLVVHGRLTVRATGRISGVVKYGELEVSAGGTIIGELQTTTVTAAQGGSGFKSAAKFTATDEDEQNQKQQRKSA